MLMLILYTMRCYAMLLILPEWSPTTSATYITTHHHADIIIADIAILRFFSMPLTLRCFFAAFDYAIFFATLRYCLHNVILIRALRFYARYDGLR